jgi:hypothetical protein
MYRELVAAKANQELKSKSASQPDPLRPARSAVRRQRTARATRHYTSTRPNQSRGHSQSTGQMLLHEFSRPERSGAASSRSYEGSESEMASGTGHAHAAPSATGVRGSERPLLRNIRGYAGSSRHLEEPGNSSSVTSISPLLEFPELTHHRLVGSEMIPQNVPNLVPRLAVDSRSGGPQQTQTPPHSSFSTPRRLPASIVPHDLSIASSTPDLAPQYQLDELDETSYAQAMIQLRIGAYRRVASQQLHSRIYERLQLSFNDLQSSLNLAREDVDGLGDRRRSFTPEDESWETLLNTITPDERLPSVHSSFTSTGVEFSSIASDSTVMSSPTIETSGVCSLVCENSESEESEIES